MAWKPYNNCPFVRTNHRPPMEYPCHRWIPLTISAGFGVWTSSRVADHLKHINTHNTHLRCFAKTVMLPMHIYWHTCVMCIDLCVCFVSYKVHPRRVFSFLVLPCFLYFYNSPIAPIPKRLPHCHGDHNGDWGKRIKRTHEFTYDIVTEQQTKINLLHIL